MTRKVPVRQPWRSNQSLTLDRELKGGQRDDHSTVTLAPARLGITSWRATFSRCATRTADQLERVIDYSQATTSG
jgi:hypothetical protein